MHPSLMNSIILAYLGDAYFEVLVRDHLVRTASMLKPKELQRESTYYVSAKAQAGFIEMALKNDWLTNEEVRQYKRGRNTKNTRSSKNLDALTHNKSTGFESVIGYYYLLENFERIREIFELYIGYVNEYKSNKMTQK